MQLSLWWHPKHYTTWRQPVVQYWQRVMTCHKDKVESVATLTLSMPVVWARNFWSYVWYWSWLSSFHSVVSSPHQCSSGFTRRGCTESFYEIYMPFLTITITLHLLPFQRRNRHVLLGGKCFSQGDLSENWLSQGNPLVNTWCHAPLSCYHSSCTKIPPWTT